ncbi:hypothetical protein [Bacteroides fragilis]|uniref:hypothetical protein n=1 Tax=Bacteroides fragilis TaxID=817 RepID=UPI00202F2CF9|nr:hypothetical protein [Bacteroides fragilis]MCM0272825.1 hypothetical protein [Bacteroides fragilis]
MKRMNAYLLTMIWILGAVLVLMLLCYVISGFDLGALVLVSILWCIPTLPFLLFIACSFIFGLKGLDHLYWAIGSLCVYGLLTYMLLTSCQMAADPKIVHGTLKVVLFFAIAFGCGCLWRPTVCNFSVVLGIAKIPATLCAVLLLGYVMLANMREMGGVNDLYWAGPQYNADKTLFYDYKMRLSPFPARVVGVRYFNKYGHYVGGSAEQPCNNVLMDMRLGDIPDGSADILLHKRYKPTVVGLLADCKKAFCYDRDHTTIYLFYKSDSLRRVEVDHHENGIISKIRKYQAGTVDEYDTVEMFDELGVPQKMFYNNNSWFRLWRINDFQVEPEVPCFKYGYASPDHPAIDERLRKVLDFSKQKEQTRDSLRMLGESGDNLNIALLLEGFIIDNHTTISVAVDADSYYGENHNSDFENLKTVRQMETICDALSLCRLESGITERIVHYYDESIKCPRIRIKENSKRNKYIIFYLLENRVVSSDFKLSFVFDPSAHMDKVKRRDAVDYWEKMHQLVDKSADDNGDMPTIESE